MQTVHEPGDDGNRAQAGAAGGQVESNRGGKHRGKALF